MHPYATDFPWHAKLMFWIAVVAVALAGVIGSLLSLLEGWVGLTLGPVSAAGLFAILYFCFDNWAWRWHFIRNIFLVPDLNGEWECKGQTVSKGGNDVSIDWRGEVCIVQSWSKIRVTLKTSQSTSQSLAASLRREAGLGYRLIYHYNNEPDVNQPHDLQRHTGVCNLVFNNLVTEANGRYFTDRDRMTVGSMQLRKKGLQE